MERGPHMVISDFSLRTAEIDVLSDENLGLMLEINVNVSIEFTTLVMKKLEMHNIMRVGTFSSRGSSEINHEMVQVRQGIHPHL